jgi:hypothetical protein
MCLDLGKQLTRFCGFKLLIVSVENISAKAGAFRHGVLLRDDNSSDEKSEWRFYFQEMKGRKKKVHLF